MTYTVSAHSDHGPDEDFTLDTLDAARAACRSLQADPDVRRIVLSGPGVHHEWTRA